jgi:hypothetical protein
MQLQRAKRFPAQTRLSFKTREDEQKARNVWAFACAIYRSYSERAMLSRPAFVQLVRREEPYTAVEQLQHATGFGVPIASRGCLNVPCICNSNALGKFLGLPRKSVLRLLVLRCRSVPCICNSNALGRFLGLPQGRFDADRSVCSI